jgi:hypothetical protein
MPEQSGKSSMKTGRLKQIMENDRANSIVALQELVKVVNVFIACDNSNSQKGINSFVKYID